MQGLPRSYVHGASATPLLGETVGANLERTVARWPDRDAVVVRHQDVRWSYAALNEAVDGLAAGLLGLGLEPGERVGIWAPNSVEWVTTQFATAKAGLILVNINPAYRLSELSYALDKVGCSALITADRFKASDYIALLRGLLPELDSAEPGALESERFPSLRSVVRLGEAHTAGMLNYAEVAAGGGAAERKRLADLAGELQFDDPINIQFTSGTTGTPKASTLTHHNILNNAYFAALQMRFCERDRLCIPVPMYHCFGMVLGSLLCVTHGAAMVYPAAGFDAHATLAAIAAERCTALHGVPTMFIAELEAPDFERFDLSSLRTGIIAGAPCPIELMHRLIEQMHLPEITIGYGMTETGPLSFQTAPDDPIDRRVETVGRVLPHTEVKIVDEAGRVVPCGEPGELLTRGYCVMPYYWDDPERTAAAIDRTRWIASGDVATLDADGYCRIVGRLKDMVIRGGENIFPREIEEFLFEHPKIADVQVIGVPDPKYGEELCACIELHEGETASAAEIRAFCEGKIAHFKIPRYIVFVEGFPMTVTGKVQKYLLREEMSEKLGLTEAKTA
ncbi:MAG TPA: AMP-binding protein [Kiloniellales bacterium]